MVAWHWNALSEPYTGADSLVTELEAGWVMNKLIREEAYQRSGSFVTIYYFELERAGEMVEIAVISNPYLRHLLAQTSAQTTLTTS